MLLLLLPAAVLALGACQQTQAPRGPEPLALGGVILPAAGQSQAQVLALNGEPERRETVDGREMWIYSRLTPDGVALRSRTAQVWFRDGVVVQADASSHLWTPNPTFPPPLPQPTADASR